MKTATELIAAINAAGVCSPLFLDEEIDLDGIEEVTTVDRSEHRWYDVGTVVYRIGDDFIGVRGPVQLKSETMGFQDIGTKCEAFEMEAVPSVTYRRNAT